MTRHECRAVALKLIFARLDNEEHFDYGQNLAFVCEVEPSEEEKMFIKTLFDAVFDNIAEVSQNLAGYLKDYEWSRVYKVDKALLLLCYAEMKIIKEVPQKVIINETLELAKEYSTEKSSKFINGVIASIVGENND